MQLSKQEWEAHVLNYDIKSCSMRGYCREEGLPYQTFRYWFKRLRIDLVSNPDQSKVSKPCFLPVRQKNQSLKTTGQGRLRLELNDITIIVSAEDFNLELLQQTLSVIRSC